jgi:ABC-type enterochelin transport system ATPase subunit
MTTTRKRMTKADWNIINEALAYYDAQSLQDEFCYDDDEAERVAAAIQAARLKVWDRL